MSEFTLHCIVCGREVDAPDDVPDLTAETDLDEYQSMLEGLEVYCPAHYEQYHPSLTHGERQL